MSAWKKTRVSGKLHLRLIKAGETKATSAWEIIPDISVDMCAAIINDEIFGEERFYNRYIVTVGAPALDCITPGCMESIVETGRA